MDLEGARRHAQSLYPQMYLVGYAAKKADALYLASPLVKLRINPIKHWDYTYDYMAGAVLEIVRDLTRDEPWGLEVWKKVVRQRILAAYGLLYSARAQSWASFARVVKRLASVHEYRTATPFWLLVVGIGILGPQGIALVRRCLPTPRIDTVKQLGT